MKNLIKLEELAMFLLGIYAFGMLDFAWWWFLVLLLAPDIGVLGYLFGNKTGAICYNLFHHKGIAIGVYLSGIFFEVEILALTGIILFSHASLDRVFGYGLKYEKGFKFTHLGELYNDNGFRVKHGMTRFPELNCKRLICPMSKSLMSG